MIILVFNLSLRFISRFGRFHKEFSLHAFHSLYPFRLSIPFTSLSLSPLYPFHLLSLSPSIPFTSLSLSPLYPFHLSLSLSLSLLSLPPYQYLFFYLSFSISPSLSLLSIILLGVSNGRFRPCLQGIIR